MRDSDDAYSPYRRKLNFMMAYEKFAAWKAAHELALSVYNLTERWPSSERYQLTAQVRRAALSVPTNISEGAAKRGKTEFRRYLDIARGSLSELTYLLHFSKDRGLVDEAELRGVDELRNRTGRLTWGLYSALGKSKTTSSDS
jgi:four helix bundle protein